MKQLTFFLLVMLCVCAKSVPAAAQYSFSLQQSIDYTLRHHPSLQVYDNSVSIAKAQATQSLSTYLPQISGSATMLDNLKLQTTVLPAGILGPEPVPVQFGTKYSTIAAVDVSQTIFDASKIVGIKASKPYAELTLLQQEQNKETLIYNTAFAYFQVLIYGEQLRILEANRAKYAQMVELLQYQYQKGTVLEKDVDRVRVSLNSTQYQIQDAVTRQRNALSALKNAMAMPLEEQISIADTINYESFATALTADSLSLAEMVEVKLSQQAIGLQRLNLKTKQATYLPTLNAVGKFGTQALTNEFSNALSGFRGFSYIGLSLNVPIFSGLRRKGQVSEEKWKLKNEELNFNINKQNLKLRFDSAKTAVVTAYSTYQSSRDNMLLAQKLLGVTDYQYQRGVASLTDYLNDDTAYKTAQGNYINSLYNLMISQLNYQKSLGSLPRYIDNIK
ncbi:MAG: hypothetical protein BGO21_02390 [Dyadobacter sp. 50-39]|uniref:TolC family protein n=1 Tax=Dyadobacter sp. 50-39 TaxID=1895756 RepID=UPI000965ADFB|nr:TolC family protein [Dyadobacter sp. 50-39]OJV12614.1 MAG: hypothetical protein BGO21_02390 [Dyadobacter sp. 50-39]